MTREQGQLGATYLGDGRTRFVVWAPKAERVEVRLEGVRPRDVALDAGPRGYHAGVVDGVTPGTAYRYRLDERLERPDPASRAQLEGVHGPSAVGDLAFPWTDAGWQGVRLAEYVVYELHVGTFSDEGTFDGVVPYLDYLHDLGVTAVELMPVAQFPGTRNWGYDGVYPFAAHASYGGVDGLRRLIDACHARGLAVVLDVVHNHLGPEGNYLGDFAPYFTDRYKTLWGLALNFDGPDSDEVRRYFVESALYWVRDCHIDALRLDAVHAILDHSPRTFLEDLSQAVHDEAARLGRRIHLIAESAANDARLLRPPDRGGYGLDAQWSDDFHHALRTVLTGETAGYYMDYGRLEQLGKAYREGFVYTGEYSAYHRRRHGTPSADIPAERFVVCIQNHDQVGNRLRGDRLSTAVSLEAQKLAAVATLLSPYAPLLFMGEEYGETAPFPYFVSHTDPELVKAVRKGRKEEFAVFGWEGEPPDPQAEETFLQAKLDHTLRGHGAHEALLDLHRELLRLRREPPFATLSKDAQTATADEAKRAILLRRAGDGREALAVLHFGKTAQRLALPLAGDTWRKALDTADARWLGPGSRVAGEVRAGPDGLEIEAQPESAVVLLR